MTGGRALLPCLLLLATACEGGKHASAGSASSAPPARASDLESARRSALPTQVAPELRWERTPIFKPLLPLLDVSVDRGKVYYVENGELWVAPIGGPNETVVSTLAEGQRAVVRDGVVYAFGAGGLEASSVEGGESRALLPGTNVLAVWPGPNGSALADTTTGLWIIRRGAPARKLEEGTGRSIAVAAFNESDRYAVIVSPESSPKQGLHLVDLEQGTSKPMGVEITTQRRGLSWVAWPSAQWIVFATGDGATTELAALPVEADGTVRGDPVRLPALLANRSIAPVFGSSAHFLSYHQEVGYEWDTGIPTIARMASGKGCARLPSSWTSDGSLLVAESCGTDVTIHRLRQPGQPGERVEEAKGMWPVRHDDHLYFWTREGALATLRRTEWAAPITTIPFPVLHGWSALAEVGPKCNREECVLRQALPSGYRWVRLDPTTGELGSVLASTLASGGAWSLHPTRPELSFVVDSVITVVDTKTAKETSFGLELKPGHSVRALATLARSWIVASSAGHRTRLVEVTRTSTKELRSMSWPLISIRVSPDETNMTFVYDSEPVGELFNLTIADGKSGADRSR